MHRYVWVYVPSAASDGSNSLVKECFGKATKNLDLLKAKVSVALNSNVKHLIATTNTQ